MLFGILSLKISYGSEKNKKLYKCHYLENEEEKDILIAYAAKKLAFEKAQQKFYVSFRKTNDGSRGILTEMIGVIDNVHNFYSFQVKQFGFHSLQNKWKMVRAPDEKAMDQKNYPTIYTIDPKGSLDLDDGFNVIMDKECQVNIYITNVPKFLEENHLWDVLSLRCSTVYLPDRIVNMLHQDMAEMWCSLRENHTRNCVVFTFHVQNGSILKISVRQETVWIKKNFHYDTDELLQSNVFQNLEKITNDINGKSLNSHEIIEFWMIQVNRWIAQELQRGIFRCTEQINHPFFEYRGVYVTENNMGTHHGMNGKRYVHATSPIRRLVDIVNLTFLQKQKQCYSFTEKAILFCEKVQHNLNEINTMTRDIKKLQMRCKWVDFAETHDGIVLEGTIMKKEIKDEHTFRYIVFFQKVGFIKDFISFENFENGDYKFRILYFPLSGTWKQKIKIEMVNG